MKNKKHVWVAGAMCVLPLMGMAQQTEPLTDSRRGESVMELESF